MVFMSAKESTTRQLVNELLQNCIQDLIFLPFQNLYIL